MILIYWLIKYVCCCCEDCSTHFQLLLCVKFLYKHPDDSNAFCWNFKWTSDETLFLNFSFDWFVAVVRTYFTHYQLFWCVQSHFKASSYGRCDTSRWHKMIHFYENMLLMANLQHQLCNTWKRQICLDGKMGRRACSWKSIQCWMLSDEEQKLYAD